VADGHIISGLGKKMNARIDRLAGMPKRRN